MIRKNTYAEICCEKTDNFIDNCNGCNTYSMCTECFERSTYRCMVCNVLDLDLLYCDRCERKTRMCFDCKIRLGVKMKNLQ